MDKSKQHCDNIVSDENATPPTPEANALDFSSLMAQFQNASDSEKDVVQTILQEDLIAHL
jgi:hypothetical protein